MMSIRNHIKYHTTDKAEAMDKLEKLMLRISAFSVMYIVPAVIRAACLYYQYVMMPLWTRTWFQLSCTRDQRPRQQGLPSYDFAANCPPASTNAAPEFLVFVFKYLMSLVVGITCAVWICSGKTVTSWHNFYAVVVWRRSMVPTQPPNV